MSLKRVLKYLRIDTGNKVINGINNKIISKSPLKNIVISISGNNNLISIGSQVQLSNVRIIIYGNNHSCIVDDHCRMNAGELWFEDDGCLISIGEGTTIESAHIAVTESGRSIKIGKHCMFSSGIQIRTGDSHSIVDIETSKRINFAKNVVVGDHVWIGANAFILKGVVIGNNSIVGTGSIVTKDVDENCIVAGAPAKVIRRDVNWTRERITE